MKTYITFILITLLFVVILSCSKESAKNKPENVLKELSQTEKFIEKRKFYSSDTLNTIKKAVDKGLVNEIEKNHLLYDLNKNIEWEILKSVISPGSSGKKAKVIIQYTNHPIENMIGFKMMYNFVVEEGKWKIDLKKEVEEALALVKKSDHKKYLNNIREKNTVR